MPLPASVTSFVGRQRELEEIQRLLRCARLLTLVGPGGVGKTRLVLEALSQTASDEPAEVTFVDLTSVGEPQVLTRTVAFAAGVRDAPEDLMLARLADRFGLREHLLVLDNCEHVIGLCAELAATLLAACPRLRILATSREPLDIDGETSLRLQPLREQDAVALFVDRARAVSPGFDVSLENRELIAQVCNRLDRIPLAIELAASRLSGFSLSEIVNRVDHRFALLNHARRMVPPRQQTLRATLDWSYELLCEDERLLLLRVSVFTGGCTLEAIEKVASVGEIQPDYSLELVSRLVNKSLVQADHQSDGTVRYRMLESIRQYAAELWPTSDDPGPVLHRHAAFYTSLVQRTVGSPVLDSDPIFDELEVEHDNIRSALRWLIDRRDVDNAVRLATALGPFWFFNGHFGEGRAWLREVLALRHTSELNNGTLLMRAGQLAWCQGDFKTARPYLEESVRLLQRAGDRAQLAQAVAVLGHVSRTEGNYAAAITLYEQVLATCQSVTNVRAQANALLGRSQTAYEQGDARLTLAWANQTLEFAQDHGLKSIAVGALQLIGAIEEHERRLTAAYDRLAESVALARSLGPRGQWWVVMGLPGLARVVAAQGDVARAARLAADGAELARALGDQQAIARALESRAWVATEARQYRRALRLAAVASTLRERTRAPLGELDNRFVTQLLERCRAALGRQQAAACWSEGQSLTLEAALDEVAHPEVVSPTAASGRTARGGLTPREGEVVTLIARGLSNRQIAEALVITEATAVRHISNILAKLGMTSRAQIAVWAVSHASGDPVPNRATAQHTS